MFIALFTEIHWLLLNIVSTDIETFIVPVHQCLYSYVLGVYRQHTELWSHCRLYLTVVMETFFCLWETISCSSEREIWGSRPESSEIVKCRFCKNCLQNNFHQFWHHQVQSATTIFVVHISSAFSELSASSSSIIRYGQSLRSFSKLLSPSFIMSDPEIW